jgi:hypothetical protein
MLSQKCRGDSAVAEWTNSAVGPTRAAAFADTLTRVDDQQEKESRSGEEGSHVGGSRSAPPV